MVVAGWAVVFLGVLVGVFDREGAADRPMAVDLFRVYPLREAFRLAAERAPGSSSGTE